MLLLNWHKNIAWIAHGAQNYKDFFNFYISESRAYIVGSHDLYMKEASEVSFYL